MDLERHLGRGLRVLSFTVMAVPIHREPEKSEEHNDSGNMKTTETFGGRSTSHLRQLCVREERSFGVHHGELAGAVRQSYTVFC